MSYVVLADFELEAGVLVVGVQEVSFQATLLVFALLGNLPIQISDQSGELLFSGSVSSFEVGVDSEDLAGIV